MGERIFEPSEERGVVEGPLAGAVSVPLAEGQAVRQC